jgi:transposase-like protein
VEETLNALLDAEAARLCQQRDTRAGHYERNLQTKAGEVRLRVPKLKRCGAPGCRRRHVGPEQKDLSNERGLGQPADRGEHPYIYLDGIALNRSWAGEVRNVLTLVAIGVNENGYRVILGICKGAKEDKAGGAPFSSISKNAA